MRKILTFIPLVFILFLLVGCISTPDPVDLVAPSFSGETSITYEIGDVLPSYVGFFSAFDDVDGDLTSSIIIDDSEINYIVTGTYPLTITVSDVSGNTSNLVINVYVVDTGKPSILGAVDITYTIGDSIPDYLLGVTADDVADGDLTSSIIIDDSEINYIVTGTYPLTITVSDVSGNTSNLVINVYVVDNGKPSILGAVDITYTIGDSIPDYLLGVTADDVVDGDLTNNIIINSSNINLDVAGTYDLVYSVHDGENHVTSVIVKVIVIDPNAVIPIEQLNIYYINDLHGAITYESDEMGLARVGNLVMDEKSKNPDNTLFIGGGDLLQGTLISNYFEGASTINALDAIGMDAFILGNHEFDWGLPMVTRYRDPLFVEDQIHAPILGANIFLDGTQTRPDFVDPYTIIQKGNIKVGIIGVIGYGLESSIAVSKIQGYYFANPIYWATYYTEYLRSTEQVDIVLVVLHDNGISTGFNQTMSQLSGDRRVDAVFNAHSHSSYSGYISRSGETSMPYIQSSSNGKNLGWVRLFLSSDKNVTSATAANLTSSSDSRLAIANTQITNIIESYEIQIEPLLTEVLMVSGEYMSQSALSFYMAKLMREATDSDVAFQNLGGTRASILDGQDITVATIYQIFPFDNKIKTTYLTGAQINEFINRSGGAYNDVKDGVTFESMVYYKVATNDYVFDQTYNPFISGIDPEDTGILIRDIFEQVLRNQNGLYDFFLLTNPVVLSNSSYSIDVFILQSKSSIQKLYI